MSAVLAKRVEREFVLLGETSPQIISVALFIPIRHGRVDASLAVPMIEIDWRPS